MLWSILPARLILLLKGLGSAYIQSLKNTTKQYKNCTHIYIYTEQERLCQFICIYTHIVHMAKVALSFSHPFLTTSTQAAQKKKTIQRPMAASVLAPATFSSAPKAVKRSSRLNMELCFWNCSSHSCRAFWRWEKHSTFFWDDVFWVQKKMEEWLTLLQNSVDWSGLQLTGIDSLFLHWCNQVYQPLNSWNVRSFRRLPLLKLYLLGGNQCDVILIHTNTSWRRKIRGFAKQIQFHFTSSHCRIILVLEISGFPVSKVLLIHFWSVGFRCQATHLAARMLEVFFGQQRSPWSQMSVDLHHWLALWNLSAADYFNKWMTLG